VNELRGLLKGASPNTLWDSVKTLQFLHLRVQFNFAGYPNSILVDLNVPALALFNLFATPEITMLIPVKSKLLKLSSKGFVLYHFFYNELFFFFHTLATNQFEHIVDIHNLMCLFC
jgi:hypothetical protein